MKLPGPDHPITVAANPNRVRVLYRGHLLADTAGALTLREGGYKPVHYIPREDVSMLFLASTDHHTYCPYKGEASYFNIVRDGQIAENAVWSYEEPYSAVGVIKDYLGFYPSQVEIVEGEPVAASGDTIRDIVEHTDSGSGRSQLDHWPPNVEAPTSIGVQPVERPYKDTGAI